MNYKIRLFLCIAVAYLFLLMSCRQQTSSVQIEYKRNFPIDTTVVLQGIPMEVPTTPAIPYRLGDRLLVFGSYQMLHIYTYPDLRFVRSFQLPRFASENVVGDELYLENQGKVDVYRLNHSDSLVLNRSFPTISVPYSVGKVYPLSRGNYIFTGSSIDGVHEFHITNPETGVCKSGGEYPEPPIRFRRLEDFKTAYTHSLCVKPDQTAFVVTYSNVRRIHIYGADCTLRHALHLDYEPNNNHLVDPGFEYRIFHCQGSVVTDRYIYIVNPEQKLNQPKPHGDILVLDWEGNLKARYRLDMYIDGIVVDEERKMIVGCGDKGKGKGRQFFRLELLK